MQQDRLPVVQRMIISDTPEARAEALAELLPFQKDDFVGILDAMAGHPVTIRLLDPPLHEFLPSLEELLVETTELRITKGENDPAYLEKMQVLGARARAARAEPDARPARVPAWASSIPRSTRCRCARSSRPRASCASAASTRSPTS